MPSGAPRRHENGPLEPLFWGVAVSVGRPACNWCCEPARPYGLGGPRHHQLLLPQGSTHSRFCDEGHPARR